MCYGTQLLFNELITYHIAFSGVGHYAGHWQPTHLTIALKHGNNT